MSAGVEHQSRLNHSFIYYLQPKAAGLRPLGLVVPQPPIQGEP